MPLKVTTIAPEVISSSETVISVSNLNHSFGKGALQKQVLFDINLEINAGEIVIMTGPSGSGKTTLLSLGFTFCPKWQFTNTRTGNVWGK